MSELTTDLEAALGGRGVLTGGELDAAVVDWRGVFHGQAAALARPRRTDDVVAVLAVCERHGAVVVTQGGNTGLSGGATPLGPGPNVIVSLAQMNTIESVDPDRFTVTVQAGCTIEAIQEAAHSAGRLFGPDWGARGTATIGGAIATNAGGINVLRYGTMRDNVLGLEVVLADGRVWDGLRALRKDSSGYDLKHLFVGSEGTLGVITRAVLRLFPQVEHEQSAFAALTDIDHLMELFARARHNGEGELTAFELVPEAGVARACALGSVRRPLGTEAEWYALVRFSGGGQVTERMADFLADAAASGLITDAAVAGSPEQERNLWELRDEVSPAGRFEHQADVLKLDTAVPIDLIGEYHRRLVETTARIVPGAVPYAFGHVGDGNMHAYVFPDEAGQLAARKAELTAAIDELTWELGGTISAEHGIGVDLRDRIRGQKPEVELELMGRLKQMLDPDERLNPGVGSGRPPAGGPSERLRGARRGPRVQESPLPYRQS